MMPLIPKLGQMCIVHGDRTKQETRRFERLHEAMPTADTHSLRTALVVPSPHAAHHTRVFPMFESGGSRTRGTSRSLARQKFRYKYAM